MYGVAISRHSWKRGSCRSSKKGLAAAISLVSQCFIHVYVMSVSALSQEKIVPGNSSLKFSSDDVYSTQSVMGNIHASPPNVSMAPMTSSLAYRLFRT